MFRYAVGANSSAIPFYYGQDGDAERHLELRACWARRAYLANSLTYHISLHLPPIHNKRSVSALF